MASRNRKGRRLMGEINVVPYIDVMLVLLIIFMVTAPLLTQGVEVELPEASAEALDTEEEQEPIVLTVNTSGELFLNIGENPEQALPRKTIIALVSSVLKNKPQTRVMVRGDTNANYGDVVRGMTVLQAAGAPSVGLITDSREIDRDSD
ncbi:MAG: protein TolR [Gammaproteobacteria bacterium]|nr:protein TolR [Gammaproteobacteria bacterium]